MRDPDRVRGVLRELRDLGLRIVLDDFGTGYSSLTYLKRLPVHELKIDRSFVRDLADDTEDRTIVRSTILLAHALGLTVVAEGVENRRSLDLLAEFGCDAAQGYYLSRPLVAVEAARWLRQRSLEVDSQARAA
jgi:diguanylate cyclase